MCTDYILPLMHRYCQICNSGDHKLPWEGKKKSVRRMEGNKDADASSETLGGGNVFRKKAFNFYSRNWHLSSLLYTIYNAFHGK